MFFLEFRKQKIRISANNICNYQGNGPEISMHTTTWRRKPHLRFGTDPTATAEGLIALTYSTTYILPLPARGA